VLTEDGHGLLGNWLAGVRSGADHSAVQ
jgi:hypothetical protein